LHHPKPANPRLFWVAGDGAATPELDQEKRPPTIPDRRRFLGAPALLSPTTGRASIVTIAALRSGRILPPVVPAVVIAPAGFRVRLAKHGLAVAQREGLEEHIEPLAVVVRKRHADVEPKVVFPLAFDDRVDGIS
jgi:hypothetical protein